MDKREKVLGWLNRLLGWVVVVAALAGFSTCSRYVQQRISQDRAVRPAPTGH